MSDKMMPGDTALAANALCKACGLCCSGYLFRHVSVPKDLEETYRQLGLSIYQRPGGTVAFHQPCTCHTKDGCSIYDAQPSVCRDYFCILQIHVLNGTTPVDQAHTIIDTVRQEAAWLTQKVEGEKGFDVATFNLRNSLYAFHAKMEQQQQKRPFSAAESLYIKNAFEYAKLVDRFFKKTKLLKLYARLVQTMTVAAADANKLKLSVKVVKK